MSQVDHWSEACRRLVASTDHEARVPNAPAFGAMGARPFRPAVKRLKTPRATLSPEVCCRVALLRTPTYEPRTRLCEIVTKASTSPRMRAARDPAFLLAHALRLRGAQSQGRWSMIAGHGETLYPARSTSQ